MTFNTKIRHEEILCRIEQRTVGPDPLGGPFLQGSSRLDGVRPSPSLRLTEAGNIVRKLIQNVDKVYFNAYVDCYVIMPDHVHMVICLKSQAGLGPGRVVPPGRLNCPGDAPPRGSGPTKNCSVPKIINAIKSMSTRELGYKLWQDDYYDHIIRNKHDLQATRQYIQENPQKWLQDKD